MSWLSSAWSRIREVMEEVTPAGETGVGRAHRRGDFVDRKGSAAHVRSRYQAASQALLDAVANHFRELDALRTTDIHEPVLPHAHAVIHLTKAKCGVANGSVTEWILRPHLP